MADINELKGRRAALVNEARVILDEADQRGDGLTAEEQQKYDNIMADVDKLGAHIQREERQLQLEAQMIQTPGPTNRPEPQSNIVRPSDLRVSDEYNDAFWADFRNGRLGINNEQYRMLQEVRAAMHVGTDTAGGYLAPETLEQQIIMGLEEENIMRSLCTVISSSNDRNIPVVDSHGQAYWTDENAAYTDSDETLGQKTLRAHKLTCLIKVSEELLQDSAFDLPGYIQREFVRRMAAKEEAAFVNGDGVNKPTGIVVDAAVGVTAAAIAAVTADEIIDLYHSVKRPYRRNGTFMALDASIKAIRKLKDGDNQYLWQPGLQAGEPDRLLGRPIAASADMPAMATGNKSIIFGDFKYYWISDRIGRVFQRLNELYAANGQVGFRAFQRVDGILTMAEAIKALKQA